MKGYSRYLTDVPWIFILEMINCQQTIIDGEFSAKIYERDAKKINLHLQDK